MKKLCGIRIFKGTSFNFVMDIKDILPDTLYCGNITFILSGEEYRTETLALASRVSSTLSSFRAGTDIMETLPH